MSRSTFIIGGSVPAMLCRKPLAPPLPPWPESHTTTLSNLMFEIAFAEVSASVSRCSTIMSWNASLAPPAAATSSFMASAFFDMIWYWPRASASSFT